jgi:hypothetical protein
LPRMVQPNSSQRCSIVKKISNLVKLGAGGGT